MLRNLVQFGPARPGHAASTRKTNASNHAFVPQPEDEERPSTAAPSTKQWPGFTLALSEHVLPPLSQNRRHFTGQVPPRGGEAGESAWAYLPP